MEQRGIFVQIQIKIVGTKLNLWTITASNLKLSPKISTLFFFCQYMKWFNVSKKRKGCSNLSYPFCLQM